MEVPNMGDSITEGSIAEWVKNEGDYVAVDDVIVVIETDKVAVDVRAEVAGTLTKLHAEEGDVVEVGQSLVDVQPGEPPEGYEAEAEASEKNGLIAELGARISDLEDAEQAALQQSGSVASAEIAELEDKVGELEDNTGKTFPDEELAKVNTVQDLANLVKNGRL